MNWRVKAEGSTLRKHRKNKTKQKNCEVDHHQVGRLRIIDHETQPEASPTNPKTQ